MLISTTSDLAAIAPRQAFQSLKGINVDFHYIWGWDLRFYPMFQSLKGINVDFHLGAAKGITG